MWYLLLLYPYLTRTLGKITLQTPLSTTDKHTFSNSGQFFQKYKFMWVCKTARRHVCSFAAYAVWGTPLCVHGSVYVWIEWENLWQAAFLSDRWMGEAGLLGCICSRCITICCCKSHQKHTQTYGVWGSGRDGKKEITCARCAVSRWSGLYRFLTGRMEKISNDWMHIYTQIKSLKKSFAVSLCYSGTGIAIHTGTGYSEDE